MIINKQVIFRNSIQERILDQLQNSVITFYLTGSRYFGINEDETADYDFFVQEGVNVEEELRRFGFVKLAGNLNVVKYTDYNTASVYFHSLANIHVQVSKNAILKHITQQLIMKNLILRVELKEARKNDKEQGTKAHSRNFWNHILLITKDLIPIITEG